MADVTWEPEAKAFLDVLMGDLPFLIRSQARTTTTEEAFRLASAENLPAASKRHVVMAMVNITQHHMKGQLKAMLTKRGLDMARYAEHFK